MFVVGEIEDLVAITTHSYQLCRPQLGQVPGYRRRSRPKVIGELADRMFGVEQRG
jgi:hypothetical protein